MNILVFTRLSIRHRIHIMYMYVHKSHPQTLHIEYNALHTTSTLARRAHTCKSVYFSQMGTVYRLGYFVSIYYRLFFKHVQFWLQTFFMITISTNTFKNSFEMVGASYLYMTLTLNCKLLAHLIPNKLRHTSCKDRQIGCLL